MFAPQSPKFYHTERSARYHVEKPDRPRSDGESNMPVSQMIRMDHAVHAYCDLQFTGVCGDQRGGTGSVFKRKHREKSEFRASV